MLRTFAKFAVGTLWFGGVVASFTALWRNSATPSAPPPARWPADSAIERTAGQPTLVMFTHPRCPCSEASATELAWLAERFRGRFTATVLFARPTDVEEGWERTLLWATVSAFPGVTPLRDDDGREAARFNATTSGHVTLYDERGLLVFSGGITDVGDNLGRQAVAALLGGARGAPPVETPVHGCSLCKGAR